MVQSALGMGHAGAEIGPGGTVIGQSKFGMGVGWDRNGAWLKQSRSGMVKVGEGHVRAGRARRGLGVDHSGAG